MVELPTLYPDQQELLDRVRTALQQHRRVILCGNPGFGKTRLAKWILGAGTLREPTERQTGYGLFAVQRRGLVDNASNSFNEEPRVRHGLIMSDRKPAYGARVQVASIDTLLSWFIKDRQYDTSISFDLIVYDETHAHLPKLVKFLQHHERFRQETGKHPAYVLGLSATPECKGLAEVYRTIVTGRSTQWLIDNKRLSPYRYFGATQGRLGLLVRKGDDFTEESVSKAMAGLSGDLVRDWKRFAEGRPTVGFFPRRQHAQEAKAELENAGLKVAYVDGETDDLTRQRIFWELGEGRLDYLCNVQVVERGTDIPRIGCVQLCVAIGSVVRYRQMIGRGSRNHPEKTDCVARGTLILTQRGEVPIEQVRGDDRLWDGLNFVSHGGSVCKGIQDVITYCGLTATPDHLLKTEKGWRTIRDCACEKIPVVRTGLGGAAIRARGDHLTERRMAGPETVSVCQSAVRDLFAGIAHFLRQLAFRKNQRLSSLQSAEAVPGMVLQTGSAARAAMQQPQGKSLREIWGTWDTLQLFIGFGSVPVDQGELGDSREPATGSHRQRWSLRGWQSAVVNAATKLGAHTKSPAVSGDAQIPTTLSAGAICRHDTEAPDRTGTDVRGDRGPLSQSGVQETQREVWDILNAGPLHRFTAQGLLVHNCLVLDHGGNIKRHGFFEDDPQWSLDHSKGRVGDVQARPTIECPKCKAIYRGGKCRNCGYEPTKQEYRGQGLEYDGTELREIQVEKKPQRVLGPEELMVKMMFAAGKSGRTWKQCVGMFLGIAKKQGTPYKVPRRVTIAGRSYRTLEYNHLDGGRKVGSLFPVTVGKGHGGKFLEGDRHESAAATAGGRSGEPRW